MRNKELRNARNWTLAERIGVSRVHRANRESADAAGHHRTSSLVTLEKLIKAFKVPLAKLLT